MLFDAWNCKRPIGSNIHQF